MPTRTLRTKTVAAGSGVYVAANADTAPGASVVLMAIASFAVVALGAAGWRTLRRRRSTPPVAPASEPHEVVLDRS